MFLPKTVYSVQFADHLTGVLGIKWVMRLSKTGDFTGVDSKNRIKAHKTKLRYSTHSVS